MIAGSRDGMVRRQLRQDSASGRPRKSLLFPQFGFIWESRLISPMGPLDWVLSGLAITIGLRTAIANRAKCVCRRQQHNLACLSATDRSIQTDAAAISGIVDFR
jgi:hypothetical protein